MYVQANKMKTLIITSHPNLDESIANKTILTQIKKRVEGIEIRYLDQLYPDFKIDVEAEQKALIEADIIVFQHPFYWYSTPALLKHYLDQVFVWGFAYGSNGDKLKGKQFIQSITVGGARESYTPNGYNHFSIEEFVKPMEQTAYLAQLNYHQPIYSFRSFYAENIWNSKSEVIENSLIQANKLIDFIETKQKGNTQNVKTFVNKWFKHFDVLDENGFFTQYLAADVKMNFPLDDEFIGHKGFNDWYNSTKSQFIGTTEHHIENLIINEIEPNVFDLNMKLNLKANSKEQGRIELSVNENWHLVWDEFSNRPIIQEYLVSEIN